MRTAPTVGFLIGLVALQVVAAAYFLLDEIDDAIWSRTGGIPLVALMEMIVAAALLAGIGLSALNLWRLLVQAKERAAAIAVARGAFAALVRQRFSEWRLSAAEADVALFALKGLTIGEIAGLRGAAQGTVRSQLSQVYAKAGVNSQPMFVALFIDDLLAGDGASSGQDGAAAIGRSDEPVAAS